METGTGKAHTSVTNSQRQRRKEVGYDTDVNLSLIHIYGDTELVDNTLVKPEEADTPASEEAQEVSRDVYKRQAIQAIMMQESGGRGTDPMQCSESPYNTRFPHTPGSVSYTHLDVYKRQE